MRAYPLIYHLDFTSDRLGMVLDNVILNSLSSNITTYLSTRELGVSWASFLVLLPKWHLHMENCFYTPVVFQRSMASSYIWFNHELTLYVQPFYAWTNFIQFMHHFLCKVTKMSFRSSGVYKGNHHIYILIRWTDIVATSLINICEESFANLFWIILIF